MSAWAARDSRREEDEVFELEEEEDFLEEEEEEEDFLEEELEEDFLEETSRMFRTRPVVGSVVESSAGLWETW
jgi:hypothetical protein